MRLLKRLGTLFKKEEEEKELYMKIKLELKGLPCHAEPVFESSSSSTVDLVDAHFPAGSVWGSFAIGLSVLVYWHWFTSIGVLQCIGLLLFANISDILGLFLGCHPYFRRRMN